MKGRRVRLTDAGVGRLKPATTEYAIWDSEVPGLGVRVRSTGHRSFVWHGRVEGEPVRATVGPAALMTVEDARKQALALHVGTAPRKAEGGSGAPLFREFVLDEWLPAYRRRCAPSSCQFANRVLERQLIPAFGRLPLDAIRRIDVERWFDAYSRTAPGGANKALEILGQVMNAAHAAGHVETSPVKGIAKNPRPKLTRFLSAEEIERLLRVLDRLVEERPFRRQQADVIRLLLLTGCRVGEILKLQWSEVDGDCLNLAHTKTGPRRVWLSQAAQAIVAHQPRAASPYVFPSPRHSDKPLSDTLSLWRKARKEADLGDVRLHDLRHTVASQAVARGVPLSTVARMLGHADPKMTLRYAHVGDRDLQAAAERIGKAIGAAMESSEATVTQPTFGIEAKDWGVPATDELRQDAYHASTPTSHPTAAVINTQDLHAQLIGPNPPVTINVVFGNNQVRSIPGSIWLPVAGQGGTFDDDIQTHLTSTLRNLTDNDVARSIVVYCLDANCWLSYNAALRLDAIGYENLYWYRGGIAAWKAAGLTTRMSTAYGQ